MHTHNQFARLTLLVIIASLLLGLTIMATAESETARAIRASGRYYTPNIPGFRTYAEPPKGFNTVTAADEELATYGFLPRPDNQTQVSRLPRTCQLSPRFSPTFARCRPRHPHPKRS